MTINKGISKYSVLSEEPRMISKYTTTGSPTDGLVIDTQEVCRMYVSGWDSSQDRIPTGFITDPKIISLLDPAPTSVVSINNPYVRFMVQNIQTNFQESMQILNNFTEGFTTYTFGQEPPVFNFSGILVHNSYDNWDELFLAIYQEFLRAPRLAALSLFNRKKEYQVVVQYHNKILKGSLIAYNQSENSQYEQAVNFSFSLLVKEITFKWKASTVSTDQIDVSFQALDISSSIGTNKQTATAQTGNDNNQVSTNPALNNLA